jgi:hypothetical protein
MRIAAAILAFGVAGLSGCSAIISTDKDALGGANLSGGDGGVAAGQGDAGLPTACAKDADCDDGNACNGVETCASGRVGSDLFTGCRAGVPVQCDDGIGCTLDRCEPSVGCVFEANAALCDDGVFCTEDVCDSAAAPGADGCRHVERDAACSYCFSDGRCDAARGGCFGRVTAVSCGDGDACTDDLCDDETRSCISTPRDADGDGFPARAVDLKVCGGGSDCDDTPGIGAAIHPGAPEICNGRDDDCDGQVDDACTGLPDTCDTAQKLTLTDGRAEVSGSLASFAEDYANECGQSRGRDAVYAIAVDGVSDIVIDSLGSAAKVVLAAATTCSNAGFTELGCAELLRDNAPRSRLLLHRYDPAVMGRTLYILVDGQSATETGAFRVSVEVSAARPDDCASQVLDLGVGGKVLGFYPTAFAERLGREGGSCQLALGEQQLEAIFRVKAPRDISVALSATTSDFVPVLYARDVCDSEDEADELVCRSAGSGGAPGQLRTVNAAFKLKSGDEAFVLLDGGGLANRYTLTCTF